MPCMLVIMAQVMYHSCLNHRSKVHVAGTSSIEAAMKVLKLSGQRWHHVGFVPKINSKKWLIPNGGYLCCFTVVSPPVAPVVVVGVTPKMRRYQEKKVWCPHLHAEVHINRYRNVQYTVPPRPVIWPLGGVPFLDAPCLVGQTILDCAASSEVNFNNVLAPKELEGQCLITSKQKKIGRS